MWRTAYRRYPGLGASEFRDCELSIISWRGRWMDMRKNARFLMQ